MNSDINIIDTIDADQIEHGDQIVVDGDALENVSVLVDDDIDSVLVRGWSVEEGDMVEYHLPYDYRVDVWAI